MNLNASFGIGGINQAWTRPTSLSQGQRGLFDTFSESFAPSVDLGDPASIRERAEYAMNSGNQAKAAQLSKMANETEQRQAQAREQNIRKAYTAAQAAGRESQLEGALIQAGYSDLVGQIKQEQMDREAAMATGQNTLDRAAVAKAKQAYYSAQTEAGRKAVLEKLQDTGRGDIARMIFDEEAEAQVKQAQQSLTLAQQADMDAKRQIDSRNIPLDIIEINAERRRVPPQYRDYYNRRVEKVLEHRHKVEEFLTQGTDDIPEFVLDAAGWTEKEYQAKVGQFGKQAARRMLAAASKKTAKVDTDRAIPNHTLERISAVVAARMKVPGMFYGTRAVDMDDQEDVGAVNAVVLEVQNILEANPEMGYEEAIEIAMTSNNESREPTVEDLWNES